MNLPPSWRQASNPRTGFTIAFFRTEGGDSCEEKQNQSGQLALDLEPPFPMPFPVITKGLIEALADLLLEALGGRAMDATASEGGGHEPQNHG